ncbi:MAG: hypothetical protein IPN70_02575 [Candidatus Moraniibacteriota bacterium]|nr:MAG: hypothetical protein IPN70_02575 [Candidatus Moranbacteria bacterium]
MRTRKISRIFAFFLLISLNITYISPVFAQFSGLIEEAASIIERRYHLNLGSIQNQGEYFNVSDQKKLAPELIMNFTPTDPKPGQELTAKSFPMYFENNKEELYYTWYLQKEGCDDLDSKNNLEKCDADGDGTLTIEDWKVEASRIIANSVIERDEIKYDNDDDNDGFAYVHTGKKVAVYGGAARRQILERCYILDRETGEQHELIKGKAPDGTPGNNQNPFDCDLTTHNVRCLDRAATPSGCSLPTCFSHPSPYFTALAPDCLSDNKISCVRGKPYCIAKIYTLDDDPATYLEKEQCHDDYPDFCGSLYIDAKELTSCDNGGNNGSTYATAGCKHLFPNAKGKEFITNNKQGTSVNEVTGDGEYELQEEKFWVTDPHNDDTANTGNGDESNIVGMGIDTFTWNYQLGDKVGLVIEGTSQIPTKYDNHSKMIMWAFSKNDCPVTGKGVYYPQVKDYAVKIHTTTMDLDSCLEKNLIDPREGGQKNNIDVSLVYSPEKPMNNSRVVGGEDTAPDKDDSLGFGETLTINSSISNSKKDESHISYTWKVFISKDGTFDPRKYVRESDPIKTGDESTAGWVEITKELVKYKLVDLVEGNNISDLDISLNITEKLLKEADPSLTIEKVFPDSLGNIGHLRVRLYVKEEFAPDVSADGVSTIIIPVNNSGKRLTSSLAFLDDIKPKTFINEDPKSTANNKKVLICEDKLTLASGICYVTKNEVIAAELGKLENEDATEKLTNFSWELDGKPLLCDKNVSRKYCEDDKQTRYNFFAITGKPGERHSLTLTALEEVTGQVKTFTQTYEVVDPFIEIIPFDDNVWPKYLGAYRDAQGKYHEDISTEVFQGYFGDSAYLQAVFFPDFLKKRARKQWLCSSNLCDTTHMEIGANELPTVYFPMIDPPGHTYNVSMEAIYQQNREVREAMQRIWGMRIFETTDYWIKKAVRIEVLENNEEEDIALLTPKTFFASVLSNTPKHIWFATQAFLSILVSIFILGILYSLGRSNRSS